jgi:hypothetical protein
MNDRQRLYLFEEHSPARLSAWARRLTRFRFCRAYGGHVNDGDTLRLLLRIGSREDALTLLAALGVAEGWTELDGTTLFVSIRRDDVEFTVQDVDDVFAVTEAAVSAAQRIESRFALYDDRRIDPPLDSWHCIAPATHPELFD